MDSSQALQPAPPRLKAPWSYKWTAFIIVSLGTLISTLDGSIVNIAYPVLSETFGTDASVVAWVGIAFFLTSTSLLLTMGWVGDFLGRERLYTVGLLLFAVTLALAALAQDISQLIFLRALQGIGAAMVVSVGSAILVAAFDAKERGLAFGLLGATVGLGLAGGPLLGGVVIDLLDWRAVFYTRLPLSVVAVPLSWLFLPRQPRTPGALHLDSQGAVILLALLSGFLLAVNQGGRLGIASPLVLAAIVLAVTAFPLFIWWELRAKRPVVDVRAFRNPVLSKGVATLLAHFQAWSAVAFVLPFAMINGLGYSTAKAGLMLAVFSVVRSLTSPLTGWLSDRISHGLLMASGLVVVSVALFLLSKLGVSATVWQLAMILSLASLGSALFDPTNASSIMSTVPAERLGMAGAFIATGRQIGLSGGVALSGAILASREAHHLSSGLPQNEALVAGAGDALVVSAVIAMMGIAPFVLGKLSSLVRR